MAGHTRFGGTWREGKPYVKVGGVWKEAQYGYVRVGGVWRQWFANFNAATGGTVTDVPNYNGTGQTWRVHTFTSSGTLTVSVGSQPFAAAVQGGGAGGGYGAGGGRGAFTQNLSLNLPAGSHAVTVGAAVAGGYNEITNRNAPGNDGNPSSIGAYISAAAGVSRGSVVGPGATHTVAGSAISYGGNGGGCVINENRDDGTGNTGGGTGGSTGTGAWMTGGGGGGCQWTSGDGARGEVVVAYRIG